MFIKLSHHDTKCLISLIEEIDTQDRTEQEVKTLNKLKLIHKAQQLAKGDKSDETRG